MNPVEVVVTLVIGLAAGMISGALGVGGGSIMVPAMVLLLGVGQETAQGTSLLVILPTALAGAYTHFRRGSIDLSPTWVVGLVGAAAAAIGAVIALQLGSSTLRVLFAIFLVVMGIREIFRRTQPEP